MKRRRNRETPDLPVPQRGWIDLHSHILPGLDDGAPDEETSIAMMRTAVECGTRIMAASSHFPWNGKLRLEIYESRFREATARIRSERLPLKILRAGDLRLTPDLLEDLREKRVPAIEGTSYFLLEFDHAFVPSMAPRFVERARENGWIPIITHPERNAGFQRQPNRLLPLIRAGALSQITADSFAGRFGRTARRLAAAYLLHGCAHIVASDAHAVGSRTPDLRPGLREIVRLTDPATALRLGSDLPARILADEAIDPGEPTPLRRGFWIGAWR